MTGSVHDAEDLVQETYLRAWKAYDRFEGKSSVRTWLYRIATNTCLTALEGRQRRPLPTGSGAPSSDPTGELVVRHEVPWLEPLPDLAARSGRPRHRRVPRVGAAGVRRRAAAPVPRQRAVLLLRDVLQWKAAEVADAIGTTTAAVNSLLQRARAQLEAVGPSQDDRLGGAGLPGAAGPARALYRGVRDLRHRPAGRAVHRATRSGRCRRSPAGTRAPGHRHADRQQCPADGPATCG